jgi:hypothetical protein
MSGAAKAVSWPSPETRKNHHDSHVRSPVAAPMNWVLTVLPIGCR